MYNVMLKATSSLGATDLASSTLTNHYSAFQVTPYFQRTVCFLWSAEAVVYLAPFCVARTGGHDSGRTTRVLQQKLRAYVLCNMWRICPSLILTDPGLPAPKRSKSSLYTMLDVQCVCRLLTWRH